jgi:hypothetical protein
MLFGDHDTVHREDLSRLPNPDAIPDSVELELRNAVRCPTAAKSFALSVGRVPAAIPGYPSRVLTTFRPRSPKTEVIRERTVKVACIQSYCGRWKFRTASCFRHAAIIRSSPDIVGIRY